MSDAEVVRSIHERVADNASVFYAHKLFAEVDALARRHGLAPRSVLEIGPGANLGTLFSFAAFGARAAGVDVTPHGAVPDEFYAALRDYLLATEGFSWWRPWATARPGFVSFPSLDAFPTAAGILSSIDYRSAVSSESLPFPADHFDLVYSVAALEHVPDPRGTVEEIARVLAPGGLAIHEIDLKHHGSDDPLRFLELTDEAWRAVARPYGRDLSLQSILDGKFSGEVYCNRLRRSEWKSAFERAGLDVELVETAIELDDAAVRPERFAEPFRSLAVEELKILAIRLVARKPASRDAAP
jgi:SAM-dependent methyltransferase